MHGRGKVVYGRGEVVHGGVMLCVVFLNYVLLRYSKCLVRSSMETCCKVKV